MSRTILIQRVVNRFEQVIAVLEDADDVTADQSVEMAYQEANMRTREGTHLVRNIEGTARVDYDGIAP